MITTEALTVIRVVKAGVGAMAGVKVGGVAGATMTTAVGINRTSLSRVWVRTVGPVIQAHQHSAPAQREMYHPAGELRQSSL